MPRMTIAFEPGCQLTMLTLGSAFTMSERLWNACFSMSAVENAVTLCATDWS